MRLKTYEWGDPSNPSIVCVHGVGSHHGYFNVAAEKCWSKNFHVIAVDLRGHGNSGWDAPWTHETYLNDLIETVDGLGLERPSWVGMSFGGRLLLQLVARHPERVDRAVALEPVIELSPAMVARRAEQELTAGIWDSMKDFVDSRGYAGEVDYDMYLATYGQNFDALDDGRIKRRTSQPAVVSIFSEFASPSPPPETVSVPTMIVYGADSGLISAEQRAAYGPYVSEFVEVPGKHSVLVSAYEETTSAVERFLKQ